MVKFSVLTAEICWQVWGTPANYNEFRIFAALLHGTVVVGVSQTLRRWTEGPTYIRQGGHHVGHWPTFLVVLVVSTNMMMISVVNQIIAKTKFFTVLATKTWYYMYKCCFSTNYRRPMEYGRPLYFCVVFSSFFLFSSFSSPNLSRCRLDVCHTSTHSVALVRI